MAVKPPIVPWDSTLANIVAVTGGHQTNGFATNEIPTSGEANAFFNNAYLWFLYLLNNIGTIQRNRFPTPIIATNWAVAITDGNGNNPDPILSASGAGSAYIDLDIPTGYKLGTLIISAKGNASATLTLTLLSSAATAQSLNTTLGSFAAGAIGAGAADITLNFLASSTTNAGGQTVTVAAAGGTYTRSAGSFITDGFFIGQIISWTGFVNGGNNTAGKTITALSATVMTVVNTGCVNETGPANGTVSTGVSPTVDGTFSEQLQLTASATALSVKSLRTTVIPQ